MAVKKIKLPNNTTVDINDSRIHIYREVTGTAAVTSVPYTGTKWNITDSTITSYVDGMIVCVKVPVVGNGSYGTALQINSLGYKPIVYNVNSMISTRYDVGSVVWATYNATQTATFYDGNGSETITGCWQVMDYGSSDTLGINIRSNNITRTVIGNCYRYRICFSSADDTQWVAANHSTSSSNTTAKEVATEKINPFGQIIYYNRSSNITSGNTPGAKYLWTQYIGIDLGYSFNRTGADLALTYPAPVYVKCTLQNDGSAIINPDTPIVQALPTTSDGSIYIYLGRAYSAGNIDMTIEHPIYYHNGTKLVRYSEGVSQVKVGSTAYNPVNGIISLPSYPAAPGTLITNATTAQTASSGESMSGSITLHKVSKTGSYSDLLDKPVITSEILICNYSNNAMDKTIAEIYEAFSSGKMVFCVIENAVYVLELSLSTKCRFKANTNTAGSMSFDWITGVNSNDTDTWTFGSNAWSSKQDTLVGSGTGQNIKTINGENILGNGNIDTSQILLCNITFSDNTYTCDKSASDIVSEFSNGKSVFFKYNSYLYYCIQAVGSGSSITIKALACSTTSTSTVITEIFAKELRYVNSYWNIVTNNYYIQERLVSGTSIKTINNESILGSGNINISGGGGISNYDFTHVANTTVSTSTKTITFAANQRGSQMISVSADIGITFDVRNLSDNYLWIKNTGSAEIDVTISSVVNDQTAVPNVYVPADGISVPSGGLCEIGIIRNADGAFITSRSDLEL